MSISPCLSFPLLSLSPPPQYVVTTDYPPEPSSDYLELSLKKGDIVQVLDQHTGGRWFVRANMGGGTYAHGWFPSEYLVCLTEGEPAEETDSKDNWVQITAGKRLYFDLSYTKLVRCCHGNLHC